MNIVERLLFRINMEAIDSSHYHIHEIKLTFKEDEMIAQWKWIDNNGKIQTRRMPRGYQE